MPTEDIGADEMRTLLRSRPERLEIIDVRTREEYVKLRIKGSRLIPAAELPARLDEVDWEKEVVFVCRSGKRSLFAAEMISAAGAKVKNLKFGIFECTKGGTGEFLEGSDVGTEGG